MSALLLAVRQGFRRAALPLGCYYTVTLGLPLAHGAAQSGDAFVTHALAVVVVPLMAIVILCALREGARMVIRHLSCERDHQRFNSITK